MSELNKGAAARYSCDAAVLEEVSTLLQDLACLYYALAELIEDAQCKAAAAASSAHLTMISAQLRAHSAKFGIASGIRDADHAVLSHRAAALQALAGADRANALHHIELCDAETQGLIGQRCCMAGLSAETRNVLLLAHRVLRLSRPERSSRGSP